MELEILSFNKKLYQGRAKAVIFPGKKGEFQVLDGHADIFAVLVEGEIGIEDKKKIAISSGILAFSKDRAIVLVEEKQA